MEEVLQLLTDYPTYAVNFYGTEIVLRLVADELLTTLPSCCVMSIANVKPEDLHGVKHMILTGITGSIRDMLMFRILQGLFPATRLILISTEPLDWAGTVAVDSRG